MEGDWLYECYVRPRGSVMAGVLIPLLVVLTTGTAAARPQTLGVAARFDREQTDLVFPWWVFSNVCVEPALGFVKTEKVGTDLHLGLGVRLAPGSSETIAPYLGGRLELLSWKPDNGDGQFDVIGALVGGGEYFFGRHFSTRVEFQFEVVLPDDDSIRFGGETIVGTGTAVAATVYF